MFMNVMKYIIITLSSLIGSSLEVIKNSIIMSILRMDIKSDEIALLIGVNQNTARRYLRIMKEVYNKKKHQKITIAEFCGYYDLPYKDVFCQINKLKTKAYDQLVSDGYIEEPVVFVTQKT